jgi:hypothetical protein
MSHTCAITALLLLFSRWGIFVNKISLSQCLSRLWYPQLNTLIAGHFLLRTAGSYSIGCKLNNPKATEVASRLKLLPDLVRDALKREEEVKAWAKGVLTNLRLSLSLFLSFAHSCILLSLSGSLYTYKHATSSFCLSLPSLSV